MRLRAGAGERRSRRRLGTPHRPRPGCRPAGEGRARGRRGDGRALLFVRVASTTAAWCSRAAVKGLQAGEGRGPRKPTARDRQGSCTRGGPCRPGSLADIRALAFGGLAFRYSPVLGDSGEAGRRGGGEKIHVNKCLGLGARTKLAECALARVWFAPAGYFFFFFLRVGVDWFPVFSRGSETVRGSRFFFPHP